MLAFIQQDVARILAGFGRATELLQKKGTLTDDETFALEDAEFSIAWAYYQKQDYAASLPHIQSAYELSGKLKIRRMQGESTYALACTHALLSNSPEALRFLKEAIDLEPRYKKEAKTDKDFERIRSNAEFRKLVGS
jgi:tetratricopeptide (TPR) repeat protein